MSTSLLPVIEIETGTPATASIIWLHGLGADGNDFAGIVPQLRFPAGAAIRFIFPHAPVQPVTINGGMKMRAWYDITGIGPEFPDDGNGIRASEKHIVNLLENEQQRGIAPENIVLAGFSQGGAIALTTGLHYHKKLAGIMALSTYLPFAEDYPYDSPQEPLDANQDTPIFMAHGNSDPVVPVSYGENSYQKLLQLKYPVELKRYNMQHAVCPEEIRDINNWICTVLNLENA